ncbi:MAG: UDP-3-O-acyl-N-acetylglucosamine deacetylase [Desulfobulbaceae bacterium]|nr:UDP-3-O-acyl-N-acetylglucosamine deacetylase [Desulfobulbaceae bacterium]
MEIYQHTISRPVTFNDVGLHTGEAVKVTVLPARANHGLRFKRVGSDDSMPAFMDRVVDTSLAMTIADRGMVVSTTEHLLAALMGLGIDNALIEIDGSELPIMDGSAAPFVEDLRKASRTKQRALCRVLKITRPICCQDGDKLITITPYDGLKLTCHVDFAHATVQSQSYSVVLSPKKFSEEIAAARTFGFMEQVEALHASGYALGGSLKNAVVIGPQGVINEEGLRFVDEFARHKVLDLLGDLALLGCRVLGHVEATKSGHGQHLALMQAIAAHPECWQFVEPEVDIEQGIIGNMAASTLQAGAMILPFLNPSVATLGQPCRVSV